MENFTPTTSSWDAIVLIAVSAFVFWLWNDHVKGVERQKRREKESHEREVNYWKRRAGADPKKEE